jgi:DNA (cytosine-5)-methyltransferase 1
VAIRPQRLNAISLCAGVGGIDLGLAPYARTVCYVEREAFSASVLVARMEERALDPAPIWSDLKTFDAAAWRGKVDLVTGGYPCQPWSVAGKRAGADDPRHLWPEVLRVLVESQAPFGFFENVRGHVSKGLREVLEDLARAGFHAEWDVFSAEEEGAPHRRQRLFVFAYARGVSIRLERGRVEREGREDPLLVGGYGEAEPVAHSDSQGQPQQSGAEREKRRRVGDGRESLGDPPIVGILNVPGDSEDTGQAGGRREEEHSRSSLASGSGRGAPDVGYPKNGGVDH